MKIQCSVCEAAEADVICCADEAALCRDCDRRVHAANKLAYKHQRVPLSSSSSQIPKCDICQESLGFFFCLQDRALLCRQCDVAIHTANKAVSGHQRFLLTGVKVGLHAASEDVPSSSNGREHSLSTDQIPAQEPRQIPNVGQPAQSSGQQVQSASQHSGNNNTPMQGNNSLVGGYTSPPMLTYAGSSALAGNIPSWQLDEFLDLSGYNQSYNFMDHGSSKADSGKLGDSDCSSVLRAADGELEADDCLGQLRDSFWAVPEVPSPPTSSGLHWARKIQGPYDSSFFVPEISSPHQQVSRYRLTEGDGSNKRTRRS
ncbi:B-box zinc finger family protein [Striga asiatica]|uniref:B-box zinc finger family protein n=1 Tax=Striga asiatica TaxID=4170 RepID=A0A5A7R8P8_STRAF|nr:B-box zinc finger family protein [Striga asiatica]